MSVNFHKILFRASYTNYDSIPETDSLPEIAFIGRSNVGKSSLINSIVGQNIARASKTPGRTRQLNFFDLDCKMTIVDMPGYGYAYISKSETMNWGKMICLYLANRKQLLRIFVLIDARRGIMNLDLQILELISKSPVQTQIILTKADKISKLELENTLENVKNIIARYGICIDEVIAISSKSKSGIENLRKLIASMA